MDTAAAKRKLRKQLCIFMVSAIVAVLLCIVVVRVTAYAAPSVSFEVNADDTAEDTLGLMEVLFLFSMLGLLPSIILMMTSFTRIIIVLSFLRNALGTQQAPPNMVLTGLALFLTLFIMNPVIQEIKVQAYDPYKAGTMTQEQALDAASKPLKKFMLKQTTPKSLNLYLTISESELPQVQSEDNLETLSNLGMHIIIPAFITSELEQAFLIGFLIFIPFLIIDMVVASVLMSMGMMMLPPAMIALPFKLLMFVMIDGWGLMMETLVRGFY